MPPTASLTAAKQKVSTHSARAELTFEELRIRTFSNTRCSTCHKMSPKHLNRYVPEFTECHNVRDMNTIEQMAGFAAGMEGKRLTYRALTADDGLSSGARPRTVES